ncbi:MAG: hydrogenase maturation protease [Gammaproteobacteria bacterium]|nr:hydrogenase maturation protease [Gammaproteobacteria bacterium]
MYKGLTKPLITLVAIGNRYMGDDGIGIAILDDIKERLSEDIAVLAWESKDALSVASELLEIQTPIVIVDCADMGINAGDFKWFKQSECSLEQHHNVISTHGFGFSDALVLAETLGFKQELYFFAIQPEQIDFKQGLSKLLKKNIDVMTQSLLEHLDKLKTRL